MLQIIDISKKYGNFALQNINLEVEAGEYFVLLGRSGAGKSQLLEVISGLRNPDSGSVILDNIDITKHKIQVRQVGLVFQDFALFPHLSVFDNIAYPLRMSGVKPEEIRNKIEVLAEEINISHLINRKPEGLSGGERQRVAVARTLVRSPKIILLDEPMASIDTPLRDDLRRLLRKINRTGMTIFHVTHDYREAIRLADRVGVIHNGRVIQTGRPEMVFNNPVNRFVARFAGIQNFFKVTINREGDDYIGTGHDGFRFLLPPGDYKSDGMLMLKSEDLKISLRKPDCADNCAVGKITELNRSEAGYEAYIDTGETFYITFSEHVLRDFELKVGQEVFISFKPGAVRVM